MRLNAFVRLTQVKLACPIESWTNIVCLKRLRGAPCRSVVGSYFTNTNKLNHYRIQDMDK